MARPYSTDLRERVLRAHEAGEGSQRVLAVRFGVSVGAVCTWLAADRGEGRRGPRPLGGGRPALGGTDPRLLADLVAEWTGTAPASAAALCRALARLGLWRKKNTARERAGAR